MHYLSPPLRVALIATAVSLCGCTSVTQNTRTRMVYKSGTDRLEWESPKDYKVKKLVIDPTTHTVTVEGLAAQVDDHAVDAAQAARAADAATVTAALTLATEALKKAPIP